MVAYFCVNSSLGPTWNSSNTTMWSTTSGVTVTPTGPPQAGDTATFDANSGGGTVTVGSSINATNTLVSITAGAFTGTLDFSVNNPSINIAAAAAATGLSFSGTGAARVFKLGSGTHTFTNGSGYDFTTTTNAGAQSLASATLVFNAGNTPASVAQQSINLGGFAYGTITINGRLSGQAASLNGNVNAWSATTLNLNGPLWIASGSNSGTITNLNITGASIAQPVMVYITTQNTQISLTVTTATINYASIRNINFINPATAGNSWDLGQNTNLTVTNPTAGTGGGNIIGS